MYKYDTSLAPKEKDEKNEKDKEHKKKREKQKYVCTCFIIINIRNIM